ncbi:chemotaxis protein CheB [Kutzneria sp. CA-103260]|uniref:chemotaxis protein CheB n=1 Tax=Kutzneria sp. CA-103260 TaxID=2802641 RepID=UPI001BA5A27F|nr:chemotaxis protein CheB [Kutzneria sp. CA-103260]QUQ64025.1 chemotaxis-specific methylesterase CheB [Kutzneria sp. CA-103260]
MPQHRDVVVVGASAGGVESLRGLLATLPADLAAAVLVVLHMPSGCTSALPAILNRAGLLPARPASHGAPLRHGHVYTAIPDHHLLVLDDLMGLSRGPAENGHRPAVDALFRSTARAVGPRAIGVVLSGALDDGASGLTSIVARGGAAVVQDPADALCPGMPENALREVPTARVAPVAELAEVLTKLIAEPVAAGPANTMSPLDLVEADIAAHGLKEGRPNMDTMGDPSGFTCPDCDGSLMTVPGTRRYRCRVGHAWSLEALAERKDGQLERALWTALRTLDEKITLGRRMEQTAVERGNGLVAKRYAASVAEAAQAADVLREFIRADVLPTGEEATL